MPASFPARPPELRHVRSPQGRSFMSHLLDLASSVPNLLHSVSLDEGFHSDLRFFMMTSLVLLTLSSFSQMQHHLLSGGIIEATGLEATSS